MAAGGAIVRLLVVGALLAGAGPAAAQGGAPADPGGHLARAREAFRAGGMLAALEASRAAVEAEPASVPALLAFGGMAEFLGEFDEAQDAYTKAAALAPGSLDVLARSASLAVRVGEYDAALGLLDRIVAAHAWWVRGLFRWGPTSVQIGLTRAYPSLERFATSGPRWLAWVVDVVPRTLQVGVLRVYPLLERIVQLDIDILMEKGDFDRARRLARGYGVVEAGRNYCDEGRTRGPDWTAERIYRTFRLAALAQPEQADCIWWYGQWLTDEGYMRMGRLMVLEGTRVTPSAGNKASGENYVRVRHSGGLEVAKRAEQLALIARQRLVRDRDIEGATRLLEQAIAIEPGFPRPYAYMAQVAWARGDRDGMVGWLERGVQADPDSWRIRRTLARALVATGRIREAEPHARRAVELFGDDVGGRLLLALVLYAEGKYDEYAQHTEFALRFVAQFRHDLPDVRSFLQSHRRFGPGRSLPPAPDPRLIMGWNQD
ncbi:MAG: hypothetical protein A2W08_00270 [Candidatus Rokubacteria bacterium RBG_16_73_20]|nr:MAG: hypothetical protein A2050_01155 [Candidatus Rokubacteria bacterium GWA2_73_35]OGK94557.1 MAG: hypothetical protein A2W08_00270 [Candidatus Rokubacteria bacterium RBG_16_73_20]